MSPADTRALQERLRAEGFNVKVDGVYGGDTRAFEAQLNQRIAQQAAEAQKSANDAKRADADAKTATARADAEKAKAEAAKAAADTERIKAEGEPARIAAEAAKVSAKQTFDTGVTIGAYAVGALAGHKAAHQLDDVFKTGIAAKNVELQAAAAKLAPHLDALDKGPVRTERMSGTVAAVDKAGANKVGRGAAGPIVGGGMVALGMLSRELASKTENETIKTILNASGTAEVVAGAVVVTYDMAGRASPTKLLDVAALATVEEARAVVNGGNATAAAAAAPAPAQPTGKPPTPAARKAAAVADYKQTFGVDPPKGGAAKLEAEVARYKGLKNASDVLGREAGGILKNAASKVVKAAGKFALPLVAGATALVAMKNSAQAGESAGDVLKSGAKGATDVVTGGSASFYEEAKAAGMSTPRAVAEATVRGVYNTATFGLFEHKLHVPGSSQAEAAEAANAPKPDVASDVGDRLNDTGHAGIAGMFAAYGLNLATSMARKPGVLPKVAAVAVMPATMVAAAASAVYARDAIFGRKEADGANAPTAYLNDAAAEKATTMVLPSAALAAATAASSDGMTAAYMTQRRTKSGGVVSVTVGSYKTPK